MSRKFYYFDGTEIKLGDVVNGPSGIERRVYIIVQPETEDAIMFSCPDGGVIFVINTEGQEEDPVLMTPPDGDYWEDFEFARRCQTKD